MRKITVLSMFLCLLIGGCETAYKEQSNRQAPGVSAEPITSSIFRIRAFGNVYDDKARMADFVMLKAAETAIAHGANGFIIRSSNDLSYSTYASTPGFANSTFVGNSVQTIYSPGTIISAQVPRVDAMIELVNVKPGSTPPAGAFSAMEIVQAIGPRLRPPPRRPT